MVLGGSDGSGRSGIDTLLQFVPFSYPLPSIESFETGVSSFLVDFRFLHKELTVSD